MFSLKLFMLWISEHMIQVDHDQNKITVLALENAGVGRLDPQPCASSTTRCHSDRRESLKSPR